MRKTNTQMNLIRELKFKPKYFNNYILIDDKTYLTAFYGQSFYQKEEYSNEK